MKFCLPFAESLVNATLASIEFFWNTVFLLKIKVDDTFSARVNLCLKLPVQALHSSSKSTTALTVCLAGYNNYSLASLRTLWAFFGCKNNIT